MIYSTFFILFRIQKPNSNSIFFLFHKKILLIILIFNLYCVCFFWRHPTCLWRCSRKADYFMWFSFVFSFEFIVHNLFSNEKTSRPNNLLHLVVFDCFIINSSLLFTQLFNPPLFHFLVIFRRKKWRRIESSLILSFGIKIDYEHCEFSHSNIFLTSL